MARKCEITGKKTMFGNNVPRKGLAKKKGGAGQHIGVKTKRTFKVNLINKNFLFQILEEVLTLRFLPMH